MRRKHLQMTAGMTVALVVGLAAPAFAAGEGAPPTGQLVASIVNFVIYVGAIVYFAHKPVMAFFAGRAERLTASITEAAAREAAAKEALASARSKVDGLSGLKAATLSEYQGLGERERDTIVAQAKAQAAKIVEDAHQTATVEARAAREALETRLLDAALARAEAHLRSNLDAAAQVRWLERGIERVAQGAAAPQQG